MLRTHRVRTLDQVHSFLDGAEPVEVQPLDRSALRVRCPDASPIHGNRPSAEAEAAYYRHSEHTALAA